MEIEEYNEKTHARHSDRYFSNRFRGLYHDHWILFMTETIVLADTYQDFVEVVKNDTAKPAEARFIRSVAGMVVYQGEDTETFYYHWARTVSEIQSIQQSGVAGRVLYADKGKKIDDSIDFFIFVALLFTFAMLLLYDAFKEWL